MAPPPTLSWMADLRQRMLHMLAFKMVGTTAFTWLFFIGYFHLLRHPVHPVVVMPLTLLDSLIPFVPQALFAYLTLWFYVGIAPGLQLGFWELIVYGLWVGALCLTGLAMFYFWPTQIPPLVLDVSGLPGFETLQGVDAAGNACPSMHVAVAIFTAFRLDEILRLSGSPAWTRLFNAAWFLAIAFSTLAIKQHVVLDVVAGAVLGVVFVVPSMRWRPTAERPRRVRLAV